MTLRLILDLQRATHRVGVAVERFGDARVTQGEAHVLAHLHEAGNATVADLHSALAHKRSTLTSILDRLESRGLVTRTTHAADRRSFVVEPTAEGAAVAARVHAHFEALEADIAATTTEADRAGFAAVLRAFETAAAEPDAE
jgi:DNA-binding MarR family transcriptional regulator